VIKSLLRSTLWVYPAHVIRDQLAAGTGTFLQDLFRGIRAILIESTVPGSWEVFANPQVDPLWMQLGFPNAPAAQMAPGLASGASKPSKPGSTSKPGSNRPAAKGSSRPGAAAGSARPDPKNARPA
jgi:hypothetical protein